MEYKEIKLANGRGVAVVDAQDTDLLSKYPWYLHPKGYVQGTVNGETVLLHRFLMGALPGQQIDHANRNKLDNRRSNLRFCSHAQNQANTRLQTNPSGFRGVQKNGSKWEAHIGKQTTYLGRFVTPEEAAKAYDKAATQRYGEFACLNFPQLV